MNVLAKYRVCLFLFSAVRCARFGVSVKVCYGAEFVAYEATYFDFWKSGPFKAGEVTFCTIGLHRVRVPSGLLFNVVSPGASGGFCRFDGEEGSYPARGVVPYRGSQLDAFQDVVFPGDSDLLVSLGRLNVVVRAGLPYRFAVAFLRGTLRRRMVDSQPCTALPVATVLLMLKVVNEREEGAIFPIRYNEVVRFLRRTIRLCEVRCVDGRDPVNACSLNYARHAIDVLIVGRANLFVPGVIVSVFSRRFNFIFGLFCLLPAFRVGTRLG